MDVTHAKRTAGRCGPLAVLLAVLPLGYWLYLQLHILGSSNAKAETLPEVRVSEFGAQTRPGSDSSELQAEKFTLPAALPLHHESLPASQVVWRPPDYQSLPVVPDEIWRASRDIPTEAGYRLQAMLLRLAIGQTARIMVFGGSMTFGEGCCPKRNLTCLHKRTMCAWPSDFLHRLRQAFPSSEVEMELHARGGCDAGCSLQEMAMTLTGDTKAASDWIILDFGQNGWGTKSTIEDFIRLIHLFLPTTLVTIIYNRDMKRDEQMKANPKWSKYTKALRKLLYRTAVHYGVPFLSYDRAMQDFARTETSAVEIMWPTINFNERHHPSWSTHALFADMLVSWCNNQLNLLARLPLADRSRLAKSQTSPELRAAPSLEMDDAWIPPLRPGLPLASLEICIVPLTAHLARAPGPGSPNMSLYKEWSLYEDRPAKPGWITKVVTGENLTFNVNFSSSPRLVVQYLRSYENIGTAEMSIDSFWAWTSSQFPNIRTETRRFPLRAWWEHRMSVTESLLFKPFAEGLAHAGSRSASVSFRLVEGSKFKVIAVISC
ncbi:unnamed protein product [Symbiodinium sp. CCMP2592]|nr:unnamed protein product [Symbiodinium sp. CCMP2592]